jgi:hypothetical protein
MKMDFQASILVQIRSRRRLYQCPLSARRDWWLSSPLHLSPAFPLLSVGGIVLLCGIANLYGIVILYRIVSWYGMHVPWGCATQEPRPGGGRVHGARNCGGVARWGTLEGTGRGKLWSSSLWRPVVPAQEPDLGCSVPLFGGGLSCCIGASPTPLESLRIDRQPSRAPGPTPTEENWQWRCKRLSMSD